MPKPKKRARVPPRRSSRLSLVLFGLLAFILATQPLFFTSRNTEYGYTKSIYTIVLVSLGLLLWSLGSLSQKERRLELSWLFPVLPALVLASLLSLFGETPACVVLQSAGLILYFGFLFLFVVNAPLGDREVCVLLGALLFAGAGNAIFALLQHQGLAPGGGDPMIATMGNRQFLAGFLSYLILPMGILAVRLKQAWAWIPAVLATGLILAVTLLTQQVGVRLGLSAGLLFVGFGLGFWPAGGGNRWRWAALAAVVAAACGLVLGWMGLAALAFLGAGFALLWLLGTLLRRHRVLWIPAIGLLLLAGGLLLPGITPIQGVRQLWERHSGAIRAWDWWVGYVMWKENPLFGIGLGGYKIFFVPYKPRFLATEVGVHYAFPFPRADQAHNEYVQALAELGVFGALVFLLGLGLIVYLGFRRLFGQTDREKRLELLLLGGGLVAFFVHAIPTFPFHLPASSLAFVTILGLAMSPRYGPVGNLSLRLRGIPLLVLSGALAVFAVVVSVFAARDMVADAYLFAGQVSSNLGDLPLAKAQLTRAVELDFCPRVSLYWLGLTQARLGELPAAQKNLRSCLSRYVPENLYINLAGVDLQLGETEEARELLETLLATIPPVNLAQEARYLLAVADLQEGNYPGAKAKLEALVRENPSYIRGWLLLAEIALRRYQWEEARNYGQRALQLIEARESQIKKTLASPIPIEAYGELQSELASLGEMRKQAQAILSQLPQ